MWDSEKEEELERLRNKEYKHSHFWTNLIEDFLMWIFFFFFVSGLYHSAVFIINLFN